MEKKQKRIRVLLAKVGLDGHDRGIKVVAQALRDAGMEVIYTGLHQTPEQVVTTALQETVDILGLSFLSGAQMTLVPEIMGLLQAAKIEDEVKVIVGGFLPEDDEIDYFKKIGVKAIFDVDSRLDDIVGYIRAIVGGNGKGERRPDADHYKTI